MLEFVRDVSVACWVASRLAPADDRTLGAVVPRGYPAYARVLHPPSLPDGTPTTWARACADTGHEPHALMDWWTIGPGWRGQEPYAGSLEAEPLAVLGDVLAGFTRGWCYLALWDGFGWIHGTPSFGVRAARVPPAFAPDVLAGPRLELPRRNYLIFRGQITDLPHLGWTYAGGTEDLQSPNLMWPADRSWFVATDVDADSTLVGGSRFLVDALLGTEGVEAWPVDVSDTVDRPPLRRA